MSDTKILQAILDGQTGLKKDIQEVRRDITEVKEEVRKTEGRLTARIDIVGLQVANLEDDAPTVEEFDKLAKRVSKLENRVTKN
ncbi:hypothetical protein A2875_02215 [Candidatus Gottesmanbacteria bacterium RIFCSPHIGHO2_01_FULL_46_14]|uniref:Uncharacterized protein n=2 Tax=Candidatus Gottesmaniibacteriota TaxID=1752720 RepID=A0A1F5ZK70_9BACT|nr:MAG: hypothetical protein A2875_02215 [Candidatus Gottesmanbacteria bacterium RIFCSPHIGHO2_01_FULL_46_14]OGG28750.1 MAG: hypothetical protein A2971_00295 [Candidatus Gottesmanbacteria bacterium RIFCSPLOWO2_01_FULL_46_21]